MIWGSYNLSNLEKSDISFPLLEELFLGEAVPSGTPDDIATEVTNNVQFLRRVAPNLEGLYLNVEDSFSIELGDEFFSMIEGQARTVGPTRILTPSETTPWPQNT